MKKILMFAALFFAFALLTGCWATWISFWGSHDYRGPTYREPTPQDDQYYPPHRQYRFR